MFVGAWPINPGDAQVRISRQRILESAAKVFELYGAGRAVLEIEYFGEVNTGLGPTLEFYKLLSLDLQRRGLGLWRCTNDSVAAAGAPAAACSLQPCCVSRRVGSSIMFSSKIGSCRSHHACSRRRDGQR